MKLSIRAELKKYDDAVPSFGIIVRKSLSGVCQQYIVKRLRPKEIGA